MIIKLFDGFFVKIGNYISIIVLGVFVVILLFLYWIEKKLLFLMYCIKYVVKVYCLINSYIV